MEPADSLLGQAVENAQIVTTLRMVKAGRERIVVRKDGRVAVDLIGPPGELRTPALNRAQEALVREADLFHNHPLDLEGGDPDEPFSPDDLYFARRLAPVRTIVVAQTFLFEFVRPTVGWRRALGSGSAWEREYRSILELELRAGIPWGEARHTAWVRFSRTRRILYRREPLE